MQTALHPLCRQPNKDFSDLILSILTSVIKITSHVDKRPHSFARFSWIGDVFQEFLPSVLSIMKCLKFEKIVEASHRAGGLPKVFRFFNFQQCLQKMECRTQKLSWQLAWLHSTALEWKCRSESNIQQNVRP